MEQREIDYICVECEQENLVQLIEGLEERYTITILKAPALSLTMIRAEDSVEYQEFYLGEALTTDCEVGIDQITGYGICLGDHPQRAYCMAVIDAIIQFEKGINGEIPEEIQMFLDQQAELIQQREQKEYNKILTTRVDFKLMDEA